jgi:hypothetical protein
MLCRKAMHSFWHLICIHLFLAPLSGGGRFVTSQDHLSQTGGSTMSTKKARKLSSAQRRQASAAPRPKAGQAIGHVPDVGQPGGGKGRVDVTGIAPEGIRVDPNVTEGHPGYQESGSSEVIPPERLSGDNAAMDKKPGG